MAMVGHSGMRHDHPILPKNKPASDSPLVTQQYALRHQENTENKQPSLAGAPQEAKPEAAKAEFDRVYQAAITKKSIFKEYLERHQVMDGVNHALKALFDHAELPPNPLEYLGQQLVKRGAQQQQQQM
jgi:hypothetical protein